MRPCSLVRQQWPDFVDSTRDREPVDGKPGAELPRRPGGAEGCPHCRDGEAAYCEAMSLGAESIEEGVRAGPVTPGPFAQLLYLRLAGSTSRTFFGAAEVGTELEGVICRR